ncbi:MAG: PQQ-like beta-propeller repeat protein [Thaumarchaeota archaeon]|nr:PQQ-like beta-propeller repeat protein [Nitrososphaerota archaeon]
MAIAAIIVVAAIGFNVAPSSDHSASASVSSESRATYLPTSGTSSSSLTLQSTSSPSSEQSDASANGTCPQTFNASAFPGVTFNNTMKIFVEHTRPQNQSGPNQGAGPGDVWCLYGASNNLVNLYPSNRVLAGIAASEDGSSLVAAGWQILPGQAGVYANGLVGLFNSTGQMVWNITSSQPFFDLAANANNSVVVAANPGLVYLDESGRIIWNYSEFQSTTIVLINNGSDVVDGVGQILYPGHLNYGSALTMFDSNGRAVFNVTLPDWFFDSSDSLAYSNGYLAAGLTASGGNGTVSYYSINGSLVWSRHVDSSIQQVSFENGGSVIFVSANGQTGQNLTFDLRGDLISNQTAPQ